MKTSKSAVTLSVIIPVYKVSGFIRKCLNSILNQDFKDFELIIVDDCSPDDSIEIAISILKEKGFHSFKIIKHEVNKGLSAARQTGLEAATGTYILNIDSDDFIEPGMFSIMIDKALNDKSDVVICDFFKTYETKRELIRCSDSYVTLTEKVQIQSYLFEVLSSKKPVAVWNKMVKRDIFISNNICFLEECTDDLCVMPKVIYYSKIVSFIGKPLINYVQYNSNSISYSKKHLISIYKACCNVLSFFEDKETNRLVKPIKVYRAKALRRLLLHKDFTNIDLKTIEVDDVLMDICKGARYEEKLHYHLLMLFKAKQKKLPFSILKRIISRVG